MCIALCKLYCDAVKREGLIEKQDLKFLSATNQLCELFESVSFVK